VTSLALEKYKQSPFALKIVGKDKKAKLALTNPERFKKIVAAIQTGLNKIDSVIGPKKGGFIGGALGAVGLAEDAKQTALEAWACSDQGKLMKKTYDDAMGFWNSQGHEIYGKLCSTNGGRCAASKKDRAADNFKGVASTPIPSEVTTTWWAHKMDCSPMLKQVATALHSGVNGFASPSVAMHFALALTFYKVLQL